MSRTIKDIYQEIVQERNKRLELAEYNSDSKMSIMNGLTWVFSAVIYSFEMLLEVFAMDISNAMNQRINGTPNYYANALLQYQKGDTLSVREDGLAFGYVSVDPSKQIITQVSYSETTDDINLDSKLILKVATGEKGNLSEIPPEELILVNSYISRIKFAGTRVEVISRKGDVLIPRLSVFYDGAVPEAEVLDGIEEKMGEYIMNIEFDSGIYITKVIEAIKKVEHVTDVYIDPEATPAQGVFLACYDNDGILQPEILIPRMMHTSSGYVRQSSGKDEEAQLPNFRQSVKLIIDR